MFTILVTSEPSAWISWNVPDLWWMLILSFFGVSSISNTWPDSDWVTLLYGYTGAESTSTKSDRIFCVAGWTISPFIVWSNTESTYSI